MYIAANTVYVVYCSNSIQGEGCNLISQYHWLILGVAMVSFVRGDIHGCYFPFVAQYCSNTTKGVGGCNLVSQYHLLILGITMVRHFSFV